ncbi:MAG: ATP-binding protein [Candidatus Krumholzibacteria bacterium]|jgi:MinD superfamily P-loop ATPase|nr:ATP-binding protein [Candidatus Krumholzibacteria bacterium]
MKELVVISGKGGTGKTSLTASFAVLAERAVIADCDVDAADLHLVLSPRIRERHEFRCGHVALIDAARCTGCGICRDLCRFDALAAFADPNRTTDSTAPEPGSESVYAVDPAACEGCGVCVRFCPAQAIAFPERLSGEWMASDTRCGPLVHARLGVAAENSGKLVTVVRQQARGLAEAGGFPWIIVDGPPGIGCPVIASVTGADLVVVVTEPTLSGEHDLERVLALTRHFGIATAVCVNKWDLNPAMTEHIENRARAAGADVVGRVRYDPAVTVAQIRQRAVVETDALSAVDIAQIWQRLAASSTTVHSDTATAGNGRRRPGFGHNPKTQGGPNL